MRVGTRLRQTEYTGENRCMPCTIVNVAIAVVLGGGVWAIGAAGGVATPGAVAGVGVVAVSLAAIYFRGYLVPGTPTLTRRYFPEWLLRAFGKETSTAPTAETEEEDDAEQWLVTAGAIDTPGGSLTDEFSAAWKRAADEVEGTRATEIEGTLDADGFIEVHQAGESFRLHVDGPMVGKWHSRAAFLADYGSATVFSERFNEWDDLPVDLRSDILNRLRTRIRTCPDCGGVTERGNETIDGCCGPLEATTVSCTDCDAQLYVETCPECGGTTELGTDTAGSDPSDEVAITTCTECDARVSMTPSSLSAF